MKNLIPTRVHALLDYMLGFGLLLPYIVNYGMSEPDIQVLSALGTVVLLVSLFTNYEYSVMHLISMKVHLAFDIALGLLLIAFPFFFPNTQFFFHWPVVLGISLLILVIVSSSKPFVVRPKDLSIIQR